MKMICHSSAGELANVLSHEIADDLGVPEKPFLVLPGGTSPLPLIKALSKIKLPENLVVSTTDERRVPFASEESISGTIARLLPSVNIEPLWTPETDINTSLPFPATVTVVGMGPDGHIASIFPGRPRDLLEKKPFHVDSAPKPPAERVSLPIKYLLSTNRLILLVSGQDKLTLCEEVLDGLHHDLPLFHLIQSAPNIEIHTTP